MELMENNSHAECEYIAMNLLISHKHTFQLKCYSFETFTYNISFHTVFNPRIPINGQDHPKSYSLMGEYHLHVWMLCFVL